MLVELQGSLLDKGWGYRGRLSSFLEEKSYESLPTTFFLFCPTTSETQSVPAKDHSFFREEMILQGILDTKEASEFV